MSNLEFSTSPVAARPFCPPSLKNPMDPAGPNPKHKPSTNPNIIRWRKGELIGAGAFGRVYMGMNLDSGELLAVKQVLIAANSVAKEKAQKAHVRELEEEVKLLQNLSHPNIVRYLGTARENGALNIFLEFVPGGSIASLLGKFGSFPEPVVRMYSRQLLQGLEYLHKNGIMHRDIKGANILVDNKGCIKLADFGASKQVVELVTITGAKSMKGTPYWMAPEVIRQTGHSLPADVWSVGCTVIEMATGKAPWSQQFQEVAALFHIGTTKSHPPIPEHLSHEAQDFLLKCLKQEPNLRPTATQLLQHPFIRTEGVSTASGPPQVSHGTKASQVLDSCKRKHLSPNPLEESSVKRSMAFCQNSFMGDHDSLRFSVVDRDRIRGSFETDLNCSVRFDCDSFMLKSFKSACDDPLGFDNHLWGRQSSFNPIMDPSSFNPIHEPPDVDDGWCNLASPGIEEYKDAYNSPMASAYQHCYKEDGDFSFQCTPADDDDDDEVTESKIKAFLDEKALELKRLQTPLYMEFHEAQQTGETNSIRSYGQPKEGTDSIIAPLSYAAGRQLMAPNSSQSPSKGSSHSGHSKQQSFSIACSCDSDATVSSDSHGSGGNRSVNFDPHVESPRLHEWKGLLLETQQPLPSPSTLNSSERLRLWKEELQQELEMRREEKRMLSRLASSTKSSPASKFSSPKEKTAQRHSARKLATSVLPMS